LVGGRREIVSLDQAKQLLIAPRFGGRWVPMSNAAMVGAVLQAAGGSCELH